MKTINWAMIGCGSVTEKKGGPGLNKADNSSLAGVYSRTYEKALDYANRHQIDKVYKSVEELLTDETIDAVYIATPPSSHKEYAIAVLNSGKIPYIEKPVTTNYEDTLEIKELSEKLGIPVYIAFYRRGLEKFLKIKELIDNKTIGQVKYVNVTNTSKVRDNELNRDNLPWRVVPEISGGGKFMDVGVHVLDCLELYFGELDFLEGTVQNTGGYYDAEDTVIASFKFKSGIPGTGTWCYVADTYLNQVQIVGDKGRIVYKGLDPKDFTLIIDGVEKLYEFEVPDHVQMPLQQAIVNEILGMGQSHANFDQAVNLSKMMNVLLEKYYT